MDRRTERLKHAAADAKWAGALAYMAWQRRFSLPRMKLPTATSSRFPGVRVLPDQRVPMRDGVLLATDVYLPAETDGAVRRSAVPAGLHPQPFPAVLIRMPYGIREPYCYMPAVGRYWANRGYACVVQDVRGKFGSEGEWDPFVHEIDDGYDTIEWVSHQPWCDGRVGMTGESYYGYTQWAAAVSKHPALVCISPGDFGMDVYPMVYEGGALALSTMAMWACDQNNHRYVNFYRFDTRHLPLREMADAACLPSRLYDEVIAHPARDQLWDRFDLGAAMADVDIPVFLWGGWYDNLLPGVLDAWRALEAGDGTSGKRKGKGRRKGKDAARMRRYLVLGPTDHETTPDFSGLVGRIELPEEERSWDRVLAFFDCHLSGASDERAAEKAGRRDEVDSIQPRVRAYVIGAGRWREADEWPLPGTVFTPCYLCGRGGAPGEGGLALEPPAAGAPPDVFSYDPLEPPDWWEGEDLWAAAKHLGDRAKLHGRPDVLVFSSVPLETPLEVVGPLGAVLYVASSARDTDFVVSLCDVWPDGYVQLVQQGIRRLRWRNGPTKSELAVPGETYQLTVDLAATGHLFAADHRICVQVASAEFDRWDRNPNTGREFGADAEMTIATQTVYHDAERPSHILLPVMSGDG